ncbi:hypothetical protein RS030_192825 [Cryptosporidium xiaoi]|uniref:Protein kinase domain-containing protein n=1 Tax=Cryptosporidium xiaoi TaxID=659607 RepID=A0AAV9Y2G6_9CRYT
MEDSIYYGVYGTKITWDVGWVPIKRLQGNSYYSESWILKNDVNSSVEKLNNELEETEKDLEVCNRQIEECLQEVLKSQEGKQGEEGEEEFDIKNFNPNNMEDPNIFLENAQTVKQHLENKQNSIMESLRNLKSARLLFRWDQKSLPPHLHRLDAPWIYLLKLQTQRDQEFNEWMQKQWEEARARFFRARGLRPPKNSVTISSALGNPDSSNSNRGGSSDKAKSKKKEKLVKEENTNKPPQVPNDDMRFVAKMIYGDIGVSNTGRRFYATKSLENSRVLRSDATEAEKVMRGHWRYILLYCGGDFQESGLAPLIATTEAKYTHPKYKIRHSLALITPYCEHGNAHSLINNISGQRYRYHYTCNLLHYNLLLIIKSLAFLESYGIFHGNIKLSNLYISATGFVLLLGDFMLPLRLKKWYIEIMKNNANVPNNLSPEFRHALTKPNFKTFEDFEKEVDYHKNDVFCLGLAFLSISLIREPNEREIKRIKSFIKDSLLKLSSEPEWTAEYVELIGKMLTLDPVKRPRFRELLTNKDYEIFMGKGFFEKLKDLFTLNSYDDPNESQLQPEDEVLNYCKLSEGVVLTEVKSKESTEPDWCGVGGCSKMGSSSSKADICGTKNITSECKNSSYDGCISRRKTPGNSTGKVLSFYEDLQKYFGLEFDEDEIEHLGDGENNAYSSNVLKRGKSHDVNPEKDIGECENTIAELNRSETYNIVIDKSKKDQLVLGRDDCNEDVEELKSFLNDNVQVRIKKGKLRLKSFNVNINETEDKMIEKRLVDREDLIETVMRYICDSERNSSLPLFQSSVYAGNITSNSWYTLKNILEEEFIFEVPDGVEVIPLMGYSFSIDGSDTRSSPSLHGLSFLECLRLSLGERKVVNFKILKPQIWFRKSDSERSVLMLNNTVIVNKLKYGTTNTFDDCSVDYGQDKQDRYYCKDVIYCSTLSGSVSAIENENEVELWWSFDSYNNSDEKRNWKSSKSKVFGSMLKSAIRLPLSDSLDIGVSKIEHWLLDETTRDPYNWIPYIVPRKIIGDTTPISLYDSEDMLLDAKILWRCRYLIKSLGRYNTCLMAVANCKFIEEENANSSTNRADSSLYMKIHANQIIKKFLDNHITNYTVCFSELIDQLESWRVSHGITSEYCMEMISLFCLNGLITSECLLNYMNNKEKSLINYNKENELVSGKLFIYYICKTLLLCGISAKYLLRYQSSEFSIQHLKTRIQSIGNTVVCEVINLRDSLSNLLSEFETGKFIERSSKTFITGLHFIDILLNCHDDRDYIHEQGEYNYDQIVISEMVMSAILFFAEVKRDITFSRLIGQKYIGSKKDANHFEIDNKEILWDGICSLKYLFDLNDFGLDISNLNNSAIYIQKDSNNIEINTTSNLRFLRQRLHRVFESVQIKVHIMRVKLNIRFVNFLLQKAVDEAREELQSLRKKFNRSSNLIGFGLNGCGKTGDTKTGVFSSCCDSENINSAHLYVNDLSLDVDIPKISNYGLDNVTGNNVVYSINYSKNRNEQSDVHYGKEVNDEERTSFKSDNKSRPSSLSGALYSIAKKILNTNETKFGIMNGMKLQCCNTDKTDFRNLLDLADANVGNVEPPSWSILDSADKNVLYNNIVNGPNYLFSQRSHDKQEELILDWIKLRSWNFTESDLRWIDGCIYLGEGEYEVAILQLSPEMKIEDVARRILEEVDHSEVRQSLKNISFGESCPLILVRNYITPYGEILIPNPDISNLIGAVRSCKFN